MTEREIFLAALEIADSAERAAYVARACGDDRALCNQVEELLRTHDETSQFLETPAAATNAVVDKTVIGDSSIEDDDDNDHAPSSEAEFSKYLEPATRPGWIGRLGHYEIEAILGRGAFGIVAKAFDDKLHRVVAIKLLNPALAATSPPRKRFLREARTAAAVTHENIVAIYAVEEEPIPYLVMEYIPGQTLQQRMDANGPFDIPETLKLGRQIASGLAAAHAANLIHRDIKPANILLTGGTNERAKISDFGLARAVDDASLTSSGLIAGTPMYMSPEQARGEPLDHRTDLFSLGSVLYQMACGRPPFRAANTVAVLKRVCEDRPRPLDDVIPDTPDWLQTIIFRLLEKEREDRYQSAQEVADLLERCETELRHHGRVTSVFTAPETQVLKRDPPSIANPQRKPLAWLIGGVTALGVVVGFMVMNGGKRVPDAIQSVTSSGVSTEASPATRSIRTDSAEGFSASLPGPAAPIWKPTPEQQSFFEEVAGLTLVAQVKAVEKKLSEENPGFVGTGNVSFDDGMVSTLNISGVSILDLWPVRAYPGLTSLICNGTQPAPAKLRDISPLAGMKLTNLSFANTSVSDLSPLAGMPLERLECFSTKASDLGPLSGMPLTYLNIANTSISNLAPLAGSPLSYFSCSNTHVDDLGPLAGAPLTTCHLRLSRVTDLSPLKGAPLTTLTCNDELIASHRDLLRGIKTLETINGRPAKEWLDDSHGWPAGAPLPAIAPFNAAQAKKHQEEWAAYLKVPVEYTNSIGMKFRLIPPGEFLMGSTPEEVEAALPIAGDDQTWQDCIRSEGPLHKVILTQPFFLGTNEVTQAQFQRILETNPSRFSASGEWADSVTGLETSSFPVESVDWASARDFCQQLIRREGLQPTASTQRGMRTPFGIDPYRLPAEAEWEFACRAGTTSQFSAGDTSADLSKVGWFDDNSSERTHATGELAANAFGLHDMHGNVWEWVLDSWQGDRYAARAEKPAVDPFDPMTKDSEPLSRGGNWISYAQACRSAARSSASSAYNSSLIGFRVAMSVPAVRDLVAKKRTDVAKPAAHIPPNWPADAPKPAIAPFDAEQAKKHQGEWAAYLKVPVEYTNSIGMKFRLIPPGEFLMGGTPEEIDAALEADLTPFNGDFNWWSACLRSEGPRHRVRLTRPFYLGAHEVTQQQYQEIIGENPSENSPTGSNRERVAGLETANFPVEFLSWHDAVQFCNRLNEREQRTNRHLATMPPTLSETGTGYRLPTEAEWEFACRAGTTSRYWTGHEVDSVLKAGWFQVNDGGRTHAVGELLANPFGLFDVHGNAWEWAADGWDESWYQQFAETLAIDPVCPLTDQPVAMMKAGTWPAFENFCRAASRIPWPCDARNSLQGMRVTLSVEAVRESLKGPISSTSDAENLDIYFARNRRAAEKALAIGGEQAHVAVEIQKPYEWRTLRPGEPLPDAPFVVREWSIKGSVTAASDDLEVLAGLQHVLSLNLATSAPLDAQCIPNIAALSSSLKELVVANNNIRTSDLGKLPPMPCADVLWVLGEQVDDDWKFLTQFPALRYLEVYGASFPALGPLGDSPHLRCVRISGGGTAPDAAQVADAQKKNPHLRLLFEADGKLVLLGSDPAIQSVQRLVKAGISVEALSGDGAVKSLSTTTIEEIQSILAIRYIVKSIPRGVVLNDELRECLADVDLSNVKAEGLTDADSFVQRLIQRQDAEHLDLTDSDLTDDGLRSLGQHVGLRSLAVKGTRVTADGTAAFHRAVPGCHVYADNGDLPPEILLQAAREPKESEPDASPTR